MKKIMTILTIMFAVVLSTFGQSKIKNSQFYLFDGTNVSTNLTVTINPTNFSDIEGGGTIVIMFDDFIDYQSIDGIGTTNLTKMQLDNGAVYGIKFDYVFLSTTNKNINYNPNTVFTFITEQDTVDSYNNGIASVDTSTFYDNGVASVVVDTMSIWNNGYSVGKSDGYDDGYTDGVNGTNSVNDFAVTNLNVYPNPSNTSGTVTIECDDFNNVKVFTITGQEVFSSTSNIINVSDFTTSTGVYVLMIEDNGFNVTNTRLLVQ